MKKFYVGLHQPSDARHFDLCCIHVGRLVNRRKQLGCRELLLDSQAFRILETRGDHQLTSKEYARAASQISELCETVVVVAQDYMCEPYMFAQRLRHTGRLFTTPEHQALTISRFDELRAELPQSTSVLPVLQGYLPSDYAAHVRQYGARLKPGAWVGVGSVCKRNSSPGAIRAVLLSILTERPDLRLHGFGIKITALASPAVRQQLHSADSLAWSYNARRNGRPANNWREAAAFVDRVTDCGPVGPLFANVN